MLNYSVWEQGKRPSSSSFPQLSVQKGEPCLHPPGPSATVPSHPGGVPCRLVQHL